MPSYEVIKPCYVPFGNGKLRYRSVGKVVTLDAETAESLDGFVRPVSAAAAVRIPDTAEDTAESVRFPDTAWATIDSEVESDVGEPTPDHE